MRQKKLTILACLFSAGSGLLLAHTVSADTLPKPFSAQYAGAEKVGPFTVNATLNLQLTRTGNYLKYTSNREIKWSFYNRKFYDCSVMVSEG